jgi:4-hydroxybenzoate polyprenyltransferase
MACWLTNTPWWRRDDLSQLNAAFFTMNGVISMVFFVFVAGDILLRR